MEYPTGECKCREQSAETIELLRAQVVELQELNDFANSEFKRVSAECGLAEMWVVECQAQLEDAQDIASIALRKAWQLGQTYWQQADSEYASQWKKSDETQAKFYLSTCLLR